MNSVCDEEVFNEIFRQLSERLYTYIFHKFGAGNNPQDIVQEAFITLWDNCNKVSPEKAKSYLFTVARNKTLKGIEKKLTSNKYRDNFPDIVNKSTPHEHLEGKEFENKLYDALDKLPEKQRIAFMLNKVEGKKHKEIAEILGISQKAVEKRIYGAAAFLLEKTGKKI